MFAVVYIPDFFLQARLEGGFIPEIPAVLIEVGNSAGKNRKKARILALNDAARAESISEGITVAESQARCGKVLVLDRSKEAEKNAQATLLRIANSLTPDFEDTAPGVCTLNLTGANCDQGWNLGWQIVEELAGTAHLRVRVGIAATPDLALIVAKIADPVRSIQNDDENEFLKRLPIAVLEPPVDLAMVLTLWGIESVGDFFALPKYEVADRLGQDALDLWERAVGEKTRLLRLVKPPKKFSQTLDFDYEIGSLEPLLFALRSVLETLCARLRAAWLTAGELNLQLQFGDGSACERKFRVPDPTTEVELLFSILDTYLEGFEVQAAVVGLRLEAIPTRAIRRQFHLFESGLRDPNRFAETLGRLEALLGPENIGTPECLDTHRPDAFRVVPFQENYRPEKETRQIRAVLPGLPLHRFRPPVFADVKVCPQTHRPVEVRSVVARGRVRDIRGPWPMSGDWWHGKKQCGESPGWSRSEWDIEILHGGLYRIFCECQSEWRIDGVYG